MLTTEEKLRIEREVRAELIEEQRQLRARAELIQRIEHGELKRNAQNQYWTEVRGKVLQEIQPNRPFWRSRRAGWTIALTAAAVIALPFHMQAIGRSLLAAVSAPPAVTKPAAVPRFFSMNERIASGRFEVLPGDHVEFPIRVTPDMAGSTVTGSFSAGCESGNCVRAAIVDEANHANWLRNSPANVVWHAQDQQAMSGFEVALPPGNYYLVFSNSASHFVDKQVFLEADLNYHKAVESR